MVETLLDKPATWLSGEGPEADVAVCSSGALRRNFADFPFPVRCSEDEKRQIVERLLGALEAQGILAAGAYYALDDLDSFEAQFLAERHMITDALLRGTGPRGAYVSEDQRQGIMVNERDHVRVQFLAAGADIQATWESLNSLNEQLSRALDWAFDEELGYLTAALDQVGTGLRLSVVLHMPALSMTNGILPLEQAIREQRHGLRAVHGTLGHSKGDLFELYNAATLGLSEEEIVFHLKHHASELIAKERKARDVVMSDGLRGLEDRVGRALGAARGARLMEFDEAVDVLSSLRLGAVTELLAGFTVQQVNEAMLAAQRAHLEVKCGRGCDELHLSMERADLIRARFS